jgi:3',5'-cyclic-AMP phosphodiesterase
MPRPFLLVQITDPHMGATWGAADPVARLQAVLGSIEALGSPVDAIVITGDLADNGAADEYMQLAELLAALDVAVYVLPGNHDDRDRLRGQFEVPGDAGTPVQYAVDLGPLRLIALDTVRPGHDRGELDRERLDWLDRELARDRDKPVVIALHHPPLVTGIEAFDKLGLLADERRGLAAVVVRHPQVRAFVSGHFHRAIAGELAGRAVLATPATYLQARLRVPSEQLSFVDEPPAFAVHVLVAGELASHVQLVVR